jgi:hypothetical protein
VHDDLDYQNILVVQQDKALPPKISGIIDWDWSQTSTLESLYSYPCWIINGYNGNQQNEWADNKVLRKHFVASIDQYFPRDSPERKLVRKCFREKCYLLNCFNDRFMCQAYSRHKTMRVDGFLDGVRGLCHEMDSHPYRRFDWKADSDLEDSDAESDDQEESGDSDGGPENEDSEDGESDDEDSEGGSEVDSECGTDDQTRVDRLDG